MQLEGRLKESVYILANNHHRDPSGTNVLLRTTIDASELGDIHGAGEEVGGHVGYQGDTVGLGNGGKLNAYGLIWWGWIGLAWIGSESKGWNG